MEFVKYVRMPKENKGQNIVSLSAQAKLLKKYARELNTKKQEVVIYARANDPLKLRAQVKIVRAFARKSNLKIVRMFFEKWPNDLTYQVFNEMLAKIKGGEIKSVLVYSSDRLPRTVQARSNLYQLINANKVGLISSTQSSEILKITLWIDMGLAAFERSSRSQTIKKGLEAKNDNE